MWRRIIAYALFGLGFITITFFRHYSGELIPYPFIFWLLGLALFSGGILFLRVTPDSNDISTRNRIKKTISDLKIDGEKIVVDFSKCEIKQNNYIDERERYGHSNELLTLGFEREIQALNALGGDSMKNISQVNIIQTVIIFSKLNSRTGLTEKFVSRVIPKDEVTLSFYLDKQKQTTLYVDKVDRKKYYFDLDFLDC